MDIVFREIDFATPEHSESVRLRVIVLRKPLGISFTEDQLAEEWNQMHIAGFDESNHLVAILVMNPLSKTIVKMRQVAIDPTLQGKGIGTGLVAFTEDLMRIKKFKKIILHAREVSVPFYLRLKYDKIGELFQEVNLPHFKMEKEL